MGSRSAAVRKASAGVFVEIALVVAVLAVGLAPARSEAQSSQQSFSSAQPADNSLGSNGSSVLEVPPQVAPNRPETGDDSYNDSERDDRPRQTVAVWRATQSGELIRYLHSVRLPHIRAQITDDHGRPAVTLSGWVATQYGRDDAEAKTQAFLGRCRIDNEIEVRSYRQSFSDDEVSTAYEPGPAYVPPSSPPNPAPQKAKATRPACVLGCYLEARQKHPLAAEMMPAELFLVRYCSFVADLAGD